MRRLLLAALALSFALALACAEGGLAEPISLPAPLPAVTPIPAASPLPTPTTAFIAPVLPEATELPTATALTTATELPAATPLPTAVPPPAATELPTAQAAPPAPVLPVATPTPDRSVPFVTIGAATWPVELAITPAERSQGLSGRDVLPTGTGMLFIFEGDQHLTFWMPDMNFPLDMVWIDSGCRVVDATLNAPVPEPGQSPCRLAPLFPKFSGQVRAGN